MSAGVSAELPPEGPRDAVARAAAEGLLDSPKRLPPWLSYDAEGARLWEQITRLPEHHLTRTERGLLAAHAPALVDTFVRARGPIGAVVAPGAGAAETAGPLLTAALARQREIVFCPVEAAGTAPGLAAPRLAPRLHVVPLSPRGLEAPGWLDEVPRPRLVLLLGSPLDGHAPPAPRARLRALRAALTTGEALLLGTGLRKSPELLLPAYDDAGGVTARFNKNVLRRLNRELGASFDLTRFDHVALWNPELSRVELHLEARAPHEVAIARLGLRVSFRRGERIHTGTSYKPTEAMLAALLAAGGFAPARVDRDAEGRCALTFAWAC